MEKKYDIEREAKDLNAIAQHLMARARASSEEKRKGGNMKYYIAKRRNGFYKYKGYYDRGKRKQLYLGRASLFERIIYAIKKRFR